MSELKADWKSAVDPASGRTYWYHRVSRVSTWERPNFIEDAHADDHLNDPANAGSYEGPEEDSTPEDDNEAAYNLLRDIQNSVGQKQIELLEKLYFNIISTNCTYWATLDGLVETLVFFSASDVERDVRIASLKCLCTLAIDRAVASTVFCSNTTWLEIAEAMLHWKNEYISLICASCLFATLLIGPTSVLIDNTIRTSIERLLQNVFDDSQTGSSYFSLYHRPGTNDYGLINERVLQLWMLVAKAGHSLAAWLVLVTMNVALRDENLAPVVITTGGISVLQSLNGSSLLPKSISKHARELLLLAMSRSSYVQERVLDTLLDLSSDLSHIPIANGPDPVLVDPAQRWSDDNNDEATTLVASQYERGFYYIEEPEKLSDGTDVPQFLNIDVEWIPKSGTGWRLSSALLWCRCPTLREIIEQFWAEGGGGLELSIDASAETLSYVCKYLHEGTLYCSDSMHQLLEMARVSAELGMLGLHKMTIDSISARINRDNVHEIMGFGESHAYHELIRCCKNFLLTGRAVAVKYTTSSDPTGSNLHKAIFDSLQDVSEVLKQTPSVFPNFSHQKQLETVDNSKTSIIEVDEIVENVHYMSAMNNNANNYTGSKRTVTKGKPRSGEIYRLLLQDSQTAEAIEYNDGASIIDQFANPSIVAKQKSAGTIPGKLMKDTTRSSSQRQVAAKTRSGSNSSAPASINKGGKSLIKNGQTNKDRNEFKKVSSQINTATTKLVEYNTAMSLDPAASQEFNSREGLLSPSKERRPVSKNVHHKPIIPEKLVASSAPPEEPETAKIVKSSAVSGSLILLKSKAMQRHRNTQDVDLSQSSVSVAPTSLSIDSVVGFESSVPQKDSSLNDNLDTNSADNLASHTCPSCGRSFAVEPYNKHIKICKKVFFQKRKTFDSSKMRINAIPELKSNQIKVGSSSNTLENKKNNSKWRDQSNAFRQAMRSARSGNQTSSNSAVQNVYSPDPSLIQCPHCERRFNQQAAERHIPQCQNIIAKPSSLRKGAGSGGGVGPSFAKSSLIVRKGWQ